MSAAEEEFRKWFLESLEPLRKNSHAGFIFVFTAFPLLERYLRRKNNCPDGDSLTDAFFTNLGILFPDFIGKEREFWHCYRNGLLHQATFSRQKKKKDGIWVALPGAGISGHKPSPVYFLPGTNEFYLNPSSFFDTVTQQILGDFATYESIGAGQYHLPSVLDGSTVVPGLVPTINMNLPRRPNKP
jgi:hypothetical protein